VGLADRDYMRAPTPRRRGLSFVTIGLALFLGLIILSPRIRRWLQDHLSSTKPRIYTVRPIGVGSKSFGPSEHFAHLYPLHDRWSSFLPKAGACPGGTNAAAPVAEAERAMICALNHARMHDGLKALAVSPLLNRSSRLKALDIIRCQEFSHSACGKDPHAVAVEVGYPNVDWGENIYEGPGPFAAARIAADGWLNSPHHRENLFRSEWTEQGIALVVAKRLRGHKNVAIWVSEFGRR
jgi:uncharacterized protein YkwD